MDFLDEYFANIPYNTNVRVSKSQMLSLPAGFVPTILGEPKFGCLGQYRRGQLHAYDMNSYWLIHKDHFNPETHPIEHVVVDAPEWLVLGLAVLDAIIGEDE